MTSSIRPTIIIGIGGTGDKVVTRVKARFLETYSPDLLKRVRFLVFDTDSGHHRPVSNSMGQWVRLAPRTELIDIGGIDVGNIKDNPTRHTEIRNALPLEKIGRIHIVEGAKQVRALGRLSFFYHFDRIYQALDQAFDNVTHLVANREDMATRTRVNVFVVASSCGGTGSSSVLDFAYLIRYIANEKNIMSDSLLMTGMLVLPEAFPQTLTIPAYKKRLPANAAATLTELSYFTSNGNFYERYPGNIEIENRYAPPFNIPIIVGNRNEAGKNVRDMDELAPILAEAIFLQTGSTLGRRAASVFDNLSPDQDEHGYLRAYAIVGTATLRFHARRMRDACAYRLTTKLVMEGLLLKPDIQTTDTIHNQVSETVNTFKTKIESKVNTLFSDSTNPLELNPLIQTLKKLPDDELMLVNLKAGKLSQRSRNQIMGLVQQDIAIQGNKLVEYQRQARKNQRTLLKGILKNLDDLVHELSDDPKSNIYGAQYFLFMLDKRLQNRQGLLKKQQANIIRQLADLQDSKIGIPAHQRRLQAALGKSSWFGNPVKEPLDAFVAQHQYRLSLLIEQNLLNEVAVIFEKVEQRRLRLLQHLSALENAIQRAGTQAASNLNQLQETWQSDYLTEQNFDKLENITRYYDEIIGSLEPELSALFHNNERSPSVWLQKYDEPNVMQAELFKMINEWLMNYALERFHPIFNKSVESEIQIEHPHQSQQESLLERLRAWAVPWANHSQQPEHVNTIALLGLYDKDKSIFTNFQYQHQRGSSEIPATILESRLTEMGSTARDIRTAIASTYDNERISALILRAGLPFDAFRGFSNYRREYASYENTLASRNAAPLICYRAVLRQQEIYRLFAHAEALGFIYEQGTRGYVISNILDDDNTNRIALGETLQNAVDNLTSDRKRQETVRQYLHEWADSKSRLATIQAYEAYIQKPIRQPRMLREQLRDFASAERDRQDKLLQT